LHNEKGAGRAMLYRAYQWQDDLAAPWRSWSRTMLGMLNSGAGSARKFVGGEYMAALEMISRFELTHKRPDFAIAKVMSGNSLADVTEEIAFELPFGNLVHFKKGIEAPQPKILVIAPLSGHFSTLLRGTVETLLRDHDVYVTDWTNARDVPLSAGAFGVEDYVEYVIRFLEAIGPRAHILAVCQPCVQGLAAVAVMSEQNHPCTPRSMTLMAGPIDPRESPTEVNEFAVSKSLKWFEKSVISTVPHRFGGGGRRVYPGFLQLTASWR
jgi:poly(3-hydroxybutyrate) depolymerase